MTSREGQRPRKRRDRDMAGKRMRVTNEDRVQTLCKDFLRVRKLTTLDALHATNLMADMWGITVHRYEMSDALEWMARHQQAERMDTTADGYTRYWIK